MLFSKGGGADIAEEGATSKDLGGGGGGTGITIYYCIHTLMIVILHTCV